MKVQELIEKVNSDDRCYNIYDAENMIDGEYECVADNIDIDEHRWYKISTSVYKLEDGYVGIRGVSRLFSEMMTWSDTDVHCEAEEYEQCVRITYKPKPKS